jgi:putative membrane protein
VYNQPWLIILWQVSRRLTPWLAAIAGYCVVVILVSRAFAVPNIPLESVAALGNAVIVSLLLSFRNRAAFDRWWEGRRLWGQLINDSRNLAWKIKGYLTPDVVARFRLAEALAGFAEALKRHLRGPVHLQEIPGFEKDSAAPAHVPSHLAGQILIGLAACEREGVFDGSVGRILDVQASSLLDICGACEKIRNTPISPSYKGLLRVGIALNVLVAPWFTLAETGFWGIPAFLLVCFFLLGVEQVDTAVEEPFGTELEDLDLDRYCQIIQQSVSDILNEDGWMDAKLGT